MGGKVGNSERTKKKKAVYFFLFFFKEEEEKKNPVCGLLHKFQKKNQKVFPVLVVSRVVRREGEGKGGGGK